MPAFAGMTVEGPNDLSRQAQVSPSGPAEERARLHPPRLRRRGIDTLRRVRTRFDYRLDHSGVLRTLHRAASRGENLRDRLLLENADLFPRQFARLQLRAWAHALGADRRQSRQPRPDLSRRLR